MPAFSTVLISSPSREKSAERMEGDKNNWLHLLILMLNELNKHNMYVQYGNKPPTEITASNPNPTGHPINTGAFLTR